MSCRCLCPGCSIVLQTQQGDASKHDSEQEGYETLSGQIDNGGSKRKLHLRLLRILACIGDIYDSRFERGWQPCYFRHASRSVVDDMQSTFIPNYIVECSGVDVFLVYGQWEGESIGRSPCQLLEVVEPLGGTQGAVVAQYAVSLEQRVVGSELPLQDAQRLADGTKTGVEVDLIEGEGRLFEDGRITPGGSVGTPFSHNERHVDATGGVPPSTQRLVVASSP